MNAVRTRKPRRPNIPAAQLDPPAAIECERAVIGSLLLDNDLFPIVSSIVRAKDFSEPQHKVIFEQLEILDKTGTPFDLALIHDDLVRRGRLDASGGLHYIASLEMAVVTSVSAPDHAKTVADAARARRAAAVCAEGFRRILQGMDPDGNELTIEEAIGWTEAQFLAIQNEAISEKTRHIAEVAIDVVDRIEMVSSGRLNESGVLTHFIDFDRKTGGFHPGNLVILAARPGEGKSTIMGNWAFNIAKGGPLHGPVRSDPCDVLILSLEMTDQEITQRLLSPLSGVASTDMRKRLDPVTVERISNASMTLGALPIFIDDTPSMLPSDIRAKIHLWRDRGRDPRVVFVDHLQIVATPPGRKSGTRNEDVSEITKGLKVLAKELGITIVLLSQMNRCIEKRSRENGKAPRPLLSDLRDSGSIEQDADVVLFIYRPKRPEEEPGARVDPHTMQDASLILAKQRNGPTGDIPLVYKPAFCVFFNGTRC